MIKTVSFAFCCVSLACIALAQAPATQQASEKPATAVEPKTAVPEKGPAKPASSTQRDRTIDRLELDRTAITGNRELPKVLYIVPWKKSGLGSLAGRPAQTLLDEVLAPVDREVFRRQTDYYAKLDAQAEDRAEKLPAEKAASTESK